MKEIRDQNNSSQQALNKTAVCIHDKDNSSSDLLRENIQKQLRGNLDFAELFFPKGFLDKNKQNIAFIENDHLPIENKELPFVSDKILNRSNNKKPHSSIDLLSQLHDKSIDVTPPRHEKTLFRDKTNKVIHKLHTNNSNSNNEVAQVKNDQDHINLLLAASDYLINQGVLEEVERTINSRTISNETSDNSNMHEDKLHLGKKKGINVKNCQNRGCDQKGKKMNQLYKIEKHSNNNCVEWLCRKCYKAWKNKHYCYYCYLIYTNETNDNNSWIQCDYCNCWQHIACEEMKGKYRNIKKNNFKLGHKYKCPHCRGYEKLKIKRIRKPVSQPDEYSRKFNFNLEKFAGNLPTERKKQSSNNYMNLLAPGDYKDIYNDLMRINY